MTEVKNITSNYLPHSLGPDRPQGAFANSTLPHIYVPAQWPSQKDIHREPWLAHTSFSSTASSSFLAASVDSGADTLLGWVPEFLMSRALAWVSWSSSPSQPPHLFPLSHPFCHLETLPFPWFWLCSFCVCPHLGLRPTALLTPLGLHALLITYVLTWELFSQNWGSSGYYPLWTCSQISEVQYFFQIRGLAVAFTLVKVARKVKYI